MRDFIEFFGIVALWGLLSTLAIMAVSTLFILWWKWVLVKLLKVF